MVYNVPHKEVVMPDTQQQQSINYSLQDGIYRQVQDNSAWRQHLTEMVAYEDAHKAEEFYQGWQWQDVHCQPSTINRLIAVGIVDMVSKSRAYTYYKLRSRDDTRAALGEEDAEEEPVDAATIDGLFDLVIGHDRIKQLLAYALKAENPVHSLLHGPVGTAKTLMLSDIAKLPGAQMYLGSTTTKSGLVGMLLSYKPSYLVIDEIDKMGGDDMSPLLSVMETGIVTRLQHGHYDRVPVPTRIFAGANDLNKLSAPILNRFARFEIPAYSHTEFVDVVKGVLMRREGLGAEMSLLVARSVGQHSLDIRDAVRVARMANRNPRRVLEIVADLWPARGGVTPLRKDAR